MEPGEVVLIVLAHQKLESQPCELVRQGPKESGWNQKYHYSLITSGEELVQL